MKPRRKVLDFVRALQAEGRTPDQVEREMREAMIVVYTDYRHGQYGFWFLDVVCPDCGGDATVYRRCQVKGHKGKPILRRVYRERVTAQ